MYVSYYSLSLSLSLYSYVAKNVSWGDGVGEGNKIRVEDLRNRVRR